MITYSHQIDFSTRVTFPPLLVPTAPTVDSHSPPDTPYLSEAALGLDSGMEDLIGRGPESPACAPIHGA